MHHSHADLFRKQRLATRCSRELRDSGDKHVDTFFFPDFGFREETSEAVVTSLDLDRRGATERGPAYVNRGSNVT